MGKNLSDEEWDRLFEEQFLKEADLIEEALFSGEDLQDVEEETEEEVQAAYEDLVARLRARGEYREEDEAEVETEMEAETIEVEIEDDVDAEMEEEVEAEIEAETVGEISEEADSTSVEKVISMPDSRKSFKAARVAGFAIIGVLCVFGASMTSEANRKYFVDSVRYLTGNDTRLVISNDETNEGVGVEEYEAIKDIKEKLDIEVPDFLYRPNHFGFYNYEINERGKFAYIEYEYKDTIIALYIQKKEGFGGSMNFSLHGDKIMTTVLQYGQIPVDIFEVKAEDDVLSSYTAQWKHNDTEYQLSGKVEKEELFKIIEKIRFSP